MIDFIVDAYMQQGGCTMLLALMQQHSRWSIVTEAPARWRRAYVLQK